MQIKIKRNEDRGMTLRTSREVERAIHTDPADSAIHPSPSNIALTACFWHTQTHGLRACTNSLNVYHERGH